MREMNRWCSSRFWLCSREFGHRRAGEVTLVRADEQGRAAVGDEAVATHGVADRDAGVDQRGRAGDVGRGAGARSRRDRETEQQREQREREPCVHKRRSRPRRRRMSAGRALRSVPRGRRRNRVCRRGRSRSERARRARRTSRCRGTQAPSTPPTRRPSQGCEPTPAPLSRSRLRAARVFAARDRGACRRAGAIRCSARSGSGGSAA